ARGWFRAREFASRRRTQRCCACRCSARPGSSSNGRSWTRRSRRSAASSFIRWRKRARREPRVKRTGGRMERQTDRSDFVGIAARAAPLLLLAAAGLAVLELVWLAERGSALTPVAAGIVAASIASAVVAVALCVLGCLAL